LNLREVGRQTSVADLIVGDHAEKEQNHHTEAGGDLLTDSHSARQMTHL
jgi:hypothetical protein